MSPIIEKIVNQLEAGQFCGTLHVKFESGRVILIRRSQTPNVPGVISSETADADNTGGSEHSELEHSYFVRSECVLFSSNK